VRNKRGLNRILIYEKERCIKYPVHSSFRITGVVLVLLLLVAGVVAATGVTIVVLIVLE
jgi:hypothetical protein